MGERHDKIVEVLVNKLREKFGDKRVSRWFNNLPSGSTREEAVYRPDIIVSDDRATQKNIRYMFEVETYGGKAIAGAAVLADYCINQHLRRGIQSQDMGPRLIFVMLNPKQESRAKKRISAIESKIKNLTIDVWGIGELINKIAEFD